MIRLQRWRLSAAPHGAKTGVAKSRYYEAERDTELIHSSRTFTLGMTLSPPR